MVENKVDLQVRQASMHRLLDWLVEYFYICTNWFFYRFELIKPTCMFTLAKWTLLRLSIIYFARMAQHKWRIILAKLMELSVQHPSAIELISNMHINSTTSFHKSHFGATPPIQISCGTIQGDTLSPCLFIIFLNPLLRWLEKNNMGYHFNTYIAPQLM